MNFSLQKDCHGDQRQSRILANPLENKQFAH